MVAKECSANAYSRDRYLVLTVESFIGWFAWSRNSRGPQDYCYHPSLVFKRDEQHVACIWRKTAVGWVYWRFGNDSATEVVANVRGMDGSPCLQVLQGEIADTVYLRWDIYKCNVISVPTWAFLVCLMRWRPCLYSECFLISIWSISKAGLKCRLGHD